MAMLNGCSRMFLNEPTDGDLQRYIMAFQICVVEQGK